MEKQLDIVVHACHPSEERKLKVEEYHGPGKPGHKAGPCLQNNQSKKVLVEWLRW
jgi:hypothetical protein